MPNIPIILSFFLDTAFSWCCKLLIVFQSSDKFGSDSLCLFFQCFCGRKRAGRRLPPFCCHFLYVHYWRGCLKFCVEKDCEAKSSGKKCQEWLVTSLTVMEEEGKSKWWPGFQLWTSSITTTWLGKLQFRTGPWFLKYHSTTDWKCSKSYLHTYILMRGILLTLKDAPVFKQGMFLTMWHGDSRGGLGIRQTSVKILSLPFTSMNVSNSFNSSLNKLISKIFNCRVFFF